MQDLMLGQRVPEIFGISKEYGAIEDFSEKEGIALGYKTHSTVTKRLAKIREKAMEYCEKIDI